MIDLEIVLRNAIARGASDIHLVNNSKPIFRINKELVEMYGSEDVDENDLAEIFDIFTKENPWVIETFNEDKRIDLSYALDDVRFRVNVSLSNNSYVFTLRVIKDELPEFSALGLPEVVKKMSLLPQGLLLITGKSNTGKTTTLNVLVNELNRTRNKKIIMLENPIEYAHKPMKSLVVQKEVGHGKDCLTFSEGIMNSLREDCDVLVVGEVQDKETMDAVLEMAESGYLVIATMHTRSCSETIDKIINFYDLKEQKAIKHSLSNSLKMVLSQRLLKGLNKDLVMVPEVMIVDDIISAQIRKDKINRAEIDDAILTSQTNGSLSLVFALANLVVSERISIGMAKEQIEEKEYEHLSNIIARMKNKKI